MRFIIVFNWLWVSEISDHSNQENSNRLIELMELMAYKPVPLSVIHIWALLTATSTGVTGKPFNCHEPTAHRLRAPAIFRPLFDKMKTCDRFHWKINGVKIRGFDLQQRRNSSGLMVNRRTNDYESLTRNGKV